MTALFKVPRRDGARFYADGIPFTVHEHHAPHIYCGGGGAFTEAALRSYFTDFQPVMEARPVDGLRRFWLWHLLKGHTLTPMHNPTTRCRCECGVQWQSYPLLSAIEWVPRG